MSGDLSCDRFRHISANEEQRNEIAARWALWETFARQVAGHNVEYDKNCVPAPVSDPRGKSK